MLLPDYSFSNLLQVHRNLKKLNQDCNLMDISFEFWLDRATLDHKGLFAKRYADAPPVKRFMFADRQKMQSL